jgi:ureidoglycolate lyase
MKIIIKPKKITRKNFKKFGDLISTKKIKPININNGYAKRFNNLCRINTSSKKGNTIMSIFSAKKRKFPMKIVMMEKHPLGSQAFIPMSETKFLVFVAPKGKKPNTKKIESFIVPKQAGINYKPGIWHFPLISTKSVNFLVIDRKGIGNNLAIYKFKNEKISLKLK